MSGRGAVTTRRQALRSSCSFGAQVTRASIHAAPLAPRLRCTLRRSIQLPYTQVTGNKRRHTGPSVRPPSPSVCHYALASIADELLLLPSKTRTRLECRVGSTHDAPLLSQ